MRLFLSCLAGVLLTPFSLLAEEEAAPTVTLKRLSLDTAVAIAKGEKAAAGAY